MNITCPSCQREIPTADVNVGTDIALCRNCSQTFSFAELVRDKELPTVDLSRPPKGAWFRQDMSGFEAGSTTRSGAAFFLVPFMCVWSGFSLGGIYGTQIWHHKFNLGTSLFGIPFFLGTLLFGSFAVMTVCGRVLISVKGDAGKIFVGVGPLGWTRRFKWSAIKEIHEGNAGYQKNGQPVTGIVLEGETRLTFATGIKEERRYFILQALRTMLRRRTGSITRDRSVSML